ncbi:MAG: hypothetical protein KDI62_30195, partial [Anaerolineae bacterium]|nr:hypothetical protein [Anaerolineae bacterium]
YERAQSDWPWVGVINTWFLKRKDDSELDQSFYYFRLLDADFTPQPVYDALAETLPQAAEPALQPAWVVGWMGIRPYLFIPALAILFFALLRWLTPKQEIGD